MTVLVTGASGFIGSHLAASLVEQGESVRVLRREGSRLSALAGLPVQHCIGDIMNPASLAPAIDGCTIVYHAAAISSYWREAPETIYAVNVDGTRHVLAACRSAGVHRVVFTSSVAAIGVPPKGVLGAEDMPFDRLSATFPYADSKRLAEAEVHRAVAQGLDAVIVNPAVVIGAGDHNLISGSIITQLARRSLPAAPPGGVCVADVDAVVQGHLLAACSGRTGERYILGGENLTYREIADIVSALVGRSGPRWTVPPWALGPIASVVEAYNRSSRRPPTVSGQQVRLSQYELFFDSGKAIRELGYPLLPFGEAAQKAYRWYKDNGFLS